MSIAVTMRPRRLRTPAISAPASGTRVSRSGMNPSCTRASGRPNNCPPIITVTYSVTRSSLLSRSVVVMSRRLVPCHGLLLQRRDQPRPVELGDEVAEAGLAAALDRSGRRDRRERDDRDRGAALLGADRLGELEAVHARHLDGGDDAVEPLARLDQRQLLGRA